MKDYKNLKNEALILAIKNTKIVENINQIEYWEELLAAVTAEANKVIINEQIEALEKELEEIIK